MDVAIIEIDAAKLGRTFKNEQRVAKIWLQSLEANVCDAKKFEIDIKNGSVSVPGCEQKLSHDMIKKIEYKQKTIYTRRYTPHVIEPSFGLGRILYCVLENAYYIRPNSSSDDHKEVRAVLKLPATIAPFKCSILPLIADENQLNIAQRLCKFSHLLLVKKNNNS